MLIATLNGITFCKCKWRCPWAARYNTWLLVKLTPKGAPSLPFPSLPFPSLPFPSLPFQWRYDQYLWLMQDAGLLPEAMLRHMVAGTSLTGRLAMMTAAQMQLAWEDSRAKSTALTTALVPVVSASSVATSPNTADSIQAHKPHAVAYAAAAVQAAPVAEVSIVSKLLSCCHTD